MDWQGAERYARANRQAFNPPRASGLVVTNAEHVGEAPVASNETWDIAAEMKHLVAQAQYNQGLAEQARHRGDIEAALFDYSRVVEVVGPLKDYADQIQALNPKAEGGTPPPPPPAPVVLNEYGTYQGHGLAVDLYPLGRGQNSKGFIRTLPIDVRLEAYQFQGPLKEDSGFRYVPEWLSDHSSGLVLALGTSLHTRVARPVAPLKGGLTGREIKAFWVTHVDPSMSGNGKATAGQPVWICSNSGIEFERIGIKADAAHEHWAISYSGQLSPNGEGDPTDLFVAFGWNRRNVGVVPGPQEYLGRRGWRGLVQAPPA